MAHRKPGECYVVRFRVHELIAAGLSVVPDPLADGPPGHSLIPELRRSKYQENKPKTKETLLKLAGMASNNIAYYPAKT